MLRIAIDGACRRNGKPDCVSAGGVFILHINDEGKATHCETQYTVEYESTNQRGELNALIEALKYIHNSRVTAAQILTDSEYLFNAMTKSWYSRWEFNDWRTASGDAVKNRDLWERVGNLVDVMQAEVTYYHIKGHLISFGKSTASRFLETDGTGKLLYKEVFSKFNELSEERTATFVSNMEYAQELSKKNNGFELPKRELRNFVVMNTMADAVATRAVEAVDSLMYNKLGP